MASAEPFLDPFLDVEAAPPKANTNDRARLIIKVSLCVALAWWGFGMYTVVSTRSLAVAASLVDATIDLAAQGVLLAANAVANSGRKDAAYPVGVSRLEPIGVVVCSLLMIVASGAVIYESVRTLVLYSPGGPDMVFTDTAAVMLAVVVVVKIGVWRLAVKEYNKTQNISLEALALDNFNDILSNFFALLFASATRDGPAWMPWWPGSKLWWMDPAGGVLISIYIIRSWLLTAVEQVDMLVGREAPQEFLESVREMSEKHHPDAQVDVIRAYHFGKNFLVEVELVMDKDTPLVKSHDVGMHLQHEIELLEDCERCFVHIDYQKRNEDDHDLSVPIHNKTVLPLSRLRTGSLFQEFTAT